MVAPNLLVATGPGSRSRTPPSSAAARPRLRGSTARRAGARSRACSSHPPHGRRPATALYQDVLTTPAAANPDRPYLRRRSSPANMRRPHRPGQGDAPAVRSARPVVLPGLPGAEKRRRGRSACSEDNAADSQPPMTRHGLGPPLRRASATCPADSRGSLDFGSLARDAVRLGLAARHPGSHDTREASTRSPRSGGAARDRLDRTTTQTAWSESIGSVACRLIGATVLGHGDQVWPNFQLVVASPPRRRRCGRCTSRCRSRGRPGSTGGHLCRCS